MKLYSMVFSMGIFKITSKFSCIGGFWDIDLQWSMGARDGGGGGVLVPQIWIKNQRAKGNLSWPWTYDCSVNFRSCAAPAPSLPEETHLSQSSQFTLTLSAHRLASETASPPEHGQRLSQHSWPREGSGVGVSDPLSPICHLHSPFLPVFHMAEASRLIIKSGTFFSIKDYQPLGTGSCLHGELAPSGNWAASSRWINSIQRVNPHLKAFILGEDSWIYNRWLEAGTFCSPHF